MNRKVETEIEVVGADIKDTCMKCLHGKIIDPKLLSCAEYKQKPEGVYFRGEQCPKFKLCEEEIDLQAILDEWEDEE